MVTEGEGGSTDSGTAGATMASEGDAATTLRCTGMGWRAAAQAPAQAQGRRSRGGSALFVELGSREGIVGACGKGGQWNPAKGGRHGAGVVSVSTCAGPFVRG